MSRRMNVREAIVKWEETSGKKAHECDEAKLMMMMIDKMDSAGLQQLK